MQPKNLGNVTDPKEIQRIASENLAMQQMAAHKYYEAGAQAQHEAHSLKEETFQALLKDSKERADLKKTAKLFTIAIIVYGALQVLEIYLVIYALMWRK